MLKYTYERSYFFKIITFSTQLNVMIILFKKVNVNFTLANFPSFIEYTHTFRERASHTRGSFLFLTLNSFHRLYPLCFSVSTSFAVIATRISSRLSCVQVDNVIKRSSYSISFMSEYRFVLLMVSARLSKSFSSQSAPRGSR